MGTYATKQLPIYRYLHSRHAPNYVVADRFFQAAFGGSFLNHQYLIAARAPLDTSAGKGGTRRTACSTPTACRSAIPAVQGDRPDVVDGQLTQACATPRTSDSGKACGDFAVNTVQPSSPPSSPTGAKIPLIDDTTYPNIGDRLSAAGVSWNWYSGGWKAAAAGTPGTLFQYHHQPFNYFANYAPGQPGRSHLKDETAFTAALKRGTLPKVSFVKPYGAENEHPGYASEPNGSDHLVSLLKKISRSPQAAQHPGGRHLRRVRRAVGPRAAPGSLVQDAGRARRLGSGHPHPGARAVTSLRRSGVDHTVYDTTSILATIERSFELAPLSTRDAAVHDLRHAVAVGGR